MNALSYWLIQSMSSHSSILIYNKLQISKKTLEKKSENTYFILRYKETIYSKWSKIHTLFVISRETCTFWLEIVPSLEVVNGNRTVGCCSHIASLLWHLGHTRYVLSTITQRCPSYIDAFIDEKSAPFSSDEDSVSDTETL